MVYRYRQPGGLVVVAVGHDPVGIGAELLAEDLAGGPVVFLAKDLLVEVLEELELDRLGKALGRLDPVDDDPLHPPDELGVEVARRRAEDAGQVRLPGVPLVGFEVAPCYPAARLRERVIVGGEFVGKVPDPLRIERGVGRVLGDLPAELIAGVGLVVLGVATRR